MRTATRTTLTVALLAAGLATAGACQSATVRGTEGRSIKATTSRSMTIRRGDSAPLQVGIDRERFTGPVTVSIDQLPKGVDSDVASIHSETTSATFILRASRTADLVTNQAVSVTVADPAGRTATQFVSLDITD